MEEDMFDQINENTALKQLIESLQESTMHIVKEKEKILNERDKYKDELFEIKLDKLKESIKNN